MYIVMKVQHSELQWPLYTDEVSRSSSACAYWRCELKYSLCWCRRNAEDLCRWRFLGTVEKHGAFCRASSESRCPVHGLRSSEAETTEVVSQPGCYQLLILMLTVQRWCRWLGIMVVSIIAWTRLVLGWAGIPPRWSSQLGQLSIPSLWGR